MREAEDEVVEPGNALREVCWTLFCVALMLLLAAAFTSVTGAVLHAEGDVLVALVVGWLVGRSRAFARVRAWMLRS